MFARRPVRSRAPRILAVAVACGLAPIGCERTPTGSSGPRGAIADPTLLPVASGQAPSPAAYDALLVANQPAGLLATRSARSEEHTSELQSHSDLVCRLLLEKK